MTAVAAAWSAALLDVDGVLVETEQGVLDLWAQVCRGAGRPAPGVESHGDILGRSPEHTVNTLLADDDADVRGAALTLVRELEPQLAMAAVDGAVDLLRALRATGAPVALVTGASRARLAAVLQLVNAHADAAVTWGEAQGKPDPEPYSLAARRLGIDPADCLVVEDAPVGVLSAVAAGATCIGLAPRGSARERALHDAGATVVVDSLRSLHVGAAAGGRFSVRLHDGRPVRRPAFAVTPRTHERKTMTVTILLPDVLAARAAGARSIDVTGRTVAEVLDDAAIRHADLVQVIRGKEGISRFVNVYVNDVDVRGSGGLATPVTSGDTVHIVPAVAGG